MKAILRKGMAACAALLMGANVMAQSDVFVESNKMNSWESFSIIPKSLAYGGAEKIVFTISESEDGYESVTMGYKVVNQDLDTEAELKPYSMGLEMTKSILIWEYKDGRTESSEFNKGLKSIYFYGEESNEYSKATVTQTLFNDDEEYEFFVPIYGGEDVVYQDWSDTRHIYQNYVVVEFKIMNGTGKILHTLSAGDGFFFSNKDTKIIKIGTKVYVVVPVGVLNPITDNSEWYYKTEFYRWYEICKETSSINFVRETRAAMNISPTIAERDTQITITLNDDNNGVARELVVTSVNGQLVERRGIPAGENTVKVSAAMMRSGMYNFTLQKKGQVVDNGKVIVK
ncbi:MAG: hypothetical protein IJZ31_02665 [Bacteroidaceae bacterium]|nr:hypothetical protein [Bacteroidaceae bacterium]